MLVSVHAHATISTIYCCRSSTKTALALVVTFCACVCRVLGIWVSVSSKCLAPFQLVVFRVSSKTLWVVKCCTEAHILLSFQVICPEHGSAALNALS